MSIFVTGGTGFLGKQLVKALSGFGEEIHLLVRKNSNTINIDTQQCKIFYGDVTNIHSIKQAMRGCDTVFHMASLVKAWTRNPDEFFQINVEGFCHVMECALEEDINRFVYTSSFMAIGPSDGIANTEQTIHDPGHLHNQYERTKYLADRMIPEYLGKGLPIVTVYPCVIYGPGDITEGNLVVRIIQDFLDNKIPGILGDGSKMWNYVFIEDVIQGHLLAFEKGVIGEKYILGGENVSMATFFQLLQECTGIQAPTRRIPFWIAKIPAWFSEHLAPFTGKTPKHTTSIIDIYKHDWTYCSAKAERELGYTHIPLKEGISRTLQWLNSTK